METPFRLPLLFFRFSLARYIKHFDARTADYEDRPVAFFTFSCYKDGSFCSLSRGKPNYRKGSLLLDMMQRMITGRKSSIFPFADLEHP
ncbi:unnamed protein product [Victoria cruziana]